ncbi:MAG: hypothetical protein QNJ02_12145 [Desulfobacterales bacterium]|nr:hypothetical protein [Desulfobacterales bacterium]
MLTANQDFQRADTMGTISAKYETEKDLTIVTVEGVISADDLLEWGNSYYEGQITSLILWDVTKADLSGLQSDKLRKIAEIMSRISEARRGGKTAFVYDNPLEFGIGRMFQAYSEMEDMPFQVQSFRSFHEARKWLGV